MSEFKIKQKVTISDGFYAPVNGIIVRVETGVAKNDLNTSFGLTDYIARCTNYTRYDVAYYQKGFMDKISQRRDMVANDIQPGWHGMKCNGDYDEFEKFGVKVPGLTKKGDK